MAQDAVLTEYRIKSNKLDSEMKIALITDLHERNPDDILPLLRKAKPDLIAVAGDVLERFNYDEPEEHIKINPVKTAVFIAAYFANRVLKKITGFKNPAKTENAYRFLREASKLAPVYMSPGNHEEKLTEDDYIFLSKNNIHYLDNSGAEFIFKNQRINIGGLSSYFDDKWLKDFSQKQGFKLLLCHHPEYYDPMISKLDIDLTLSGHTHGGQIRLFGRGVLSSTVGLFPKYDKGVFDDRLVVSAGCSNTTAIPRIKNPREVVLITIENQ